MSGERCSRCQRTFPGWDRDDSLGWEAVAYGTGQIEEGAGYPLICPGCITGEERAAIDGDMEDTRRRIDELGGDE